MANLTIYTEQEVADLLKVSLRTIREERYRGRLPSIKCGREVRITEAQLHRYMTCREKENANTKSTGSKTSEGERKAPISTYSGERGALSAAQRGRLAGRKHKHSSTALS